MNPQDNNLEILARKSGGDVTTCCIWRGGPQGLPMYNLFGLDVKRPPAHCTIHYGALPCRVPDCENT